MAEEASLSHALRAGCGTLGQGFLGTHYKKPISTCWLIVLAKASVGTNLDLSSGKLDSTSCIEGLSVNQVKNTDGAGTRRSSVTTLIT